MNDIIYFNNAATTWPKPNMVKENVVKWFNQPPINSSRHCNCVKDYEDVDIFCKRKISEFLNVDTEKYDIVITPGCTYSINTVINYLFKKGYDTLVCDSTNHNSIYRTHCEKIGTTPFMVNDCCDVINHKIQNWYMALTHVNNIDGTLIDIKNVLQTLKNHNLHNPVILDITQSAGTFDVDITELDYDSLYVVCSGHKGLYSTTGIGFLIYPKYKIDIPFVSGGTGGNNSLDYEHTNSLEAGTPNELAMRSLISGIEYINSMSLDHFKITKSILVEYFRSQWSKYTQKCPQILEYFELCDTKTPESGIISLIIKNKQKCEPIIEKLSKEYNIFIRSGVHCSPLYHVNVLHCDSTLRLSFSPNNQKNEITKFFDALITIIQL